MTEEAAQKLERFLVKLRKAGERYAEAAADYERLDHMRKVVLAHEMTEAEVRGATSVAAQDRDARTSEAYRNVIDDIHRARLEMESARAELDLLKLSASIRQSQLAMERVEAQAYSRT